VVVVVVVDGWGGNSLPSLFRTASRALRSAETRFSTSSASTAMASSWAASRMTPVGVVYVVGCNIGRQGMGERGDIGYCIGGGDRQERIFRGAGVGVGGVGGTTLVVVRMGESGIGAGAGVGLRLGRTKGLNTEGLRIGREATDGEFETELFCEFVRVSFGELSCEYVDIGDNMPFIGGGDIEIMFGGLLGGGEKVRKKAEGEMGGGDRVPVLVCGR